jgi:hypothetical protein
MKVMKKSFTAKHWNLMKVCATQGMIAILLCGISMAHNNHAQLLDKEVTISLTDVSMEKALVELSNVTNIKFAYSLDQLDVKEKISIQADKRPLARCSQ